MKGLFFFLDQLLGFQCRRSTSCTALGPRDGERRLCPLLRACARAQGKAIAPADGYIVATRDTGPFEAAGLTVINPWNTQYP